MRKISYVIRMAITLLVVLSAMAGCSPTSKAPGSSTATDTPQINNPNDFSDKLPEEDQDLTIHYLPQGYAIAQSDSHVVLLDGCSAEDAEAVIQYLKDKMGVERLAQIIIPNMDPSRYSGVGQIMEAIPTALVNIPDTEQSKEFSDFLEQVSSGLNVIPLRSGSTFNIGTSTASIVGPVVEESNDPMDTTLIIRVVCGNTSFLFAGDASQKEAEALLVDASDLSSDILFANSRNTSTLPYSVLHLISPRYEVTANPLSLPDITEFHTELVEASKEPVVVHSDGTAISFG